MNLRLLFVTLVLAATTCCAFEAKQAIFTPDTRTPEQQYLGTAIVQEICMEDGLPHLYSGSGVIVSDYRVLTAAHMTSCDGDLVGVSVDAGDGPQPARIEIVLPDMDVARLWVRRSMHKYVTPIAVGPTPEVGETVCEATSMPRPTYRCGPVQPSEDGNIWVGFQAEHGNSGGGLYSHGKLVGIMVQQRRCESDVACVGLAAPLQDYPWLLEF